LQGQSLKNRTFFDETTGFPRWVPRRRKLPPLKRRFEIVSFQGAQNMDKLDIDPNFLIFRTFLCFSETIL